MPYDVFVGLAMSTLTKSVWKRRQEEVRGLVEALEANRLSVYCAATRVPTDGTFTTAPDNGLTGVLEAMEGSRVFVAFYLEPAVSSSLWVEAGMAMANKLPMLFFGRHRQHLKDTGFSWLPTYRSGRLRDPYLYVSTQSIHPFNGVATRLITRFSKKFGGKPAALPEIRRSTRREEKP